jgi:hypothetical protein
MRRGQRLNTARPPTLVGGRLPLTAGRLAASPASLPATIR